MDKKRLISFLAAAAMLALTACGDSEDSSKSKSKKDKADSSSVVQSESGETGSGTDQQSESAVDSDKPVQPAAGGKFDSNLTYYAANSSKDTVLEIKDGKFEVVSTLNTERNVKGTISEDGKIILDDGKELKYEIYDKYVKIYFTDEGDEFEFGSANDLTTHMARIRNEISKAKTPEVTTAPEETSKPTPETTTAPTQYPDDDDDENVTYDPNAHHVPLPKVDVSGDKWTQTPSGWLDDIKGTTNYKYYNRNKWSKYTGEGDPNFPNGDPAVEWAFMFVDVPNGFGTLVTPDSTPYTYELLAEMLEYDTNPNEVDKLTDDVKNRIVENAPNYGYTGATFYSKKIKSDSSNDLDKYIINFEVSVNDSDYNTKYYNGSFTARDIADSGSDKYSYSYSDSKIDMYWTVYPYTLMGKALINMRIVDKATDTTYDRIFWQK